MTASRSSLAAGPPDRLAFIETRRSGLLWRADASYVLTGGMFPSLAMDSGPWHGLTRRAAWRRAYRALGRPLLVAEDELLRRGQEPPRPVTPDPGRVQRW